jgi:hypothetical protein
MPQTFNVGSRSLFVTAVAWVFIVLGALAWLAFRGPAVADAAAQPVESTVLRWGPGGGQAVTVERLGIAATALAVLLVANFAIGQKEALIARGRPVFVALAPVDPRSLMQGDYMRLRFRLPVDVREGTGGLLDNKRPVVVAQRHQV